MFSTYTGIMKTKFFCTVLFLGILKIDSVLTQSYSTFSVGKNVNQAVGTSLLTFNVVQIQGAFNSSTNSFNVPSTGLYWLILNAGIPGSTQCDIRTRGIHQAYDLIRTHTSFTTNADTLCRESLISLTEGDRLSLSSTYPLTSDGVQQITFASFSLDETMNRIVAFQVSLSTTQSTIGKLSFDKILVDTNSGWSFVDNEYVVDIAGIYVLSVMTGTNGAQPQIISLEQNAVLVTLIRYDLNPPAEDTISKTIMRYANTNDKLSVRLASSGSTYSDVRYLTTFSGFLYAPKSKAVAWYVIKTSGIQTGLVDPVPFEEVVINFNDAGGGWNSLTNRYIVPQPGVYYINLCAGYYYNNYVNIFLLVNDQPATNIQILARGRYYYDTRGKSVILRLAEGDELRVILPSGYGLYSDANKITTFSGIRLHD